MDTLQKSTQNPAESSEDLSWCKGTRMESERTVEASNRIFEGLCAATLLVLLIAAPQLGKTG